MKKRDNQSNQMANAAKGVVDNLLHLPQFVIDNVTEMIFRLKTDGRRIYAKNSACKELGYSKEEILNIRVYDAIPNYTTDMREKAWAVLRTAGFIENKSIFINKIYKKRLGGSTS